MDTPAAPPANSAKPFFTSKTFWLNTLALVSTLIPAVGDWVKANPIEFAQAMAAANVLLRFVTSGKISLGWDSGSGISGAGKSLPALLLCCTGLGFCGFFSTSCSNIPAGATGSIYYLDSNSGAKGGLSFGNGKAAVTLLVPIIDPETGESKGRAELTVPIEASK